MSRLIHKNTRKNREFVQRKLKSTRLEIVLIGAPNKTMWASDALLYAYELLEQGDHLTAFQVAEYLIQAIPDIIDTQLLKLRVLLDLEELVESAAMVAYLLEHAGDNYGVLTAAARYSLMVGDVQSALSQARKAVLVDKKSLEAYFRIAEAYRFSGEIKKTQHVLNRCLAIKSENHDKTAKGIAQYKIALIRLANSGCMAPGQQAEIESIASSPSEDIKIRIMAAYALGKQASKTKDVDKETAWIKLANVLEYSSQRIQLSANEYRAKTRELYVATEQAEAQLRETLQRLGEPDGTFCPIFILGMPRSGTTLLEQMIGSHSDIDQSGESRAAYIAVRRAYFEKNPFYGPEDFPKGIDKFDTETWQCIRRNCIDQEKILVKKSIFVDKDLMNFRYVSLLANLFPKAKFIHISRHPMDNFYSCLKNSIPGIPQTCDIEHLAWYYIFMKRLIGFWRNNYPDRFRIIEYDQLVEDPETHMKALFEFLKLPYSDEILDFHKRKNIVRTLSVDQVRSSVYKTSKGKWESYRELLQPAIDIFNTECIPVAGVTHLE